MDICWWHKANNPTAAAHVAPEECLLEQITPAADVFGLGVTLYELLTGKLPFPEMGEGDPYPQVLQAPSTIREHRPAVPVGLEELVLRCLSRDPKARHNVAALLPSLHRYITTGPRMWPEWI